MLVIGLIREEKIPSDNRVALTPSQCKELQLKYSNIKIIVQQSKHRCFKDSEYIQAGIEVTEDMSHCSLLLGIKEVSIEALIPNKKYFFFSHTIKKQPYNRKLLQALLEKNIDFYDHETIVDANYNRLIGFGRYAGIVGSYNAFRAFGIKFGLFTIPKAETLSGKEDLVAKLKRQVLPPIKVVLTGCGKVGNGAKEILDAMKMKEVSVDNFLTKKYSEPVYVQIDVLDYNKRKDGQNLEKNDFYSNPTEYTSDFERFTKVSDIFIAGHFYGNDAPYILTQDMLKANDCNINNVSLHIIEVINNIKIPPIFNFSNNPFVKSLFIVGA